MTAFVPLSHTRATNYRQRAWVDEAVEALKRLCGEEKSAGQIAAALCGRFPGITRNAVIGKASRLGLTLRGHAGMHLRPTAKGLRVERRVRARSERNGQLVERAAESLPGSKWITILDLNECVCHFPQGDPRDLRYCGAAIPLGDRYCPGHKRVMYVPPRPYKPKES